MEILDVRTIRCALLSGRLKGAGGAFEELRFSLHHLILVNVKTLSKLEWSCRL